jgi:hypothetical protein
MLLRRQSTHIIAGKRLVCQGERTDGTIKVRKQPEAKKAGIDARGSNK